jgi:alpha-methylacyl-CoA racemase
MMLAWGMMAALWEAQRSGQGQVVDAAMTDGAAYLMAMLYGVKAAGLWSNQRGANLLDGGAFFYATYECRDGKFVAIGPIEPQFYRLFPGEQWASTTLSLPRTTTPLPGRSSGKSWPPFSPAHARRVVRNLLEGTDACVAPVLDLDEAPEHPHNAPAKPLSQSTTSCSRRRRRVSAARRPRSGRAARRRAPTRSACCWRGASTQLTRNISTIILSHSERIA